MPLAYVVPVPVRNVNRDISLNHRLASQARIQLKIRRLLHAVHLVVFHLRQIIHAVLHDHMAGGAGAASATGMFEMKTEVHRHIEQRARQAMTLVRQFGRIELKDFIGG